MASGQGLADPRQIEIAQLMRAMGAPHMPPEQRERLRARLQQLMAAQQGRLTGGRATPEQAEQARRSAALRGATRDMTLAGRGAMAGQQPVGDIPPAGPQPATLADAQQAMMSAKLRSATQDMTMAGRGVMAGDTAGPSQPPDAGGQPPPRGPEQILQGIWGKALRRGDPALKQAGQFVHYKRLPATIRDQIEQQYDAQGEPMPEIVGWDMSVMSPVEKAMMRRILQQGERERLDQRGAALRGQYGGVR